MIGYCGKCGGSPAACEHHHIVLPPAIPEGSYPGEPWLRDKLYDEGEQWRRYNADGIGGEAHTAWLSGPEEWEKYLRGLSWTVRKVGEMFDVLKEEDHV